MPEKSDFFIELLKSVLKIDDEQPHEPSIQFRDESGDMSDNRRMLEEETYSPGPEMVCPACGGDGAVRDSEGHGSLCWQCGGSGRVPAISNETREIDCPECGGSGSSGSGEGYDSMCRRCNGYGKIPA